jgi:hypothetical protein
MKEILGRRTFFQLCSAMAAWMSSPPRRAAAAPDDVRKSVRAAFCGRFLRNGGEAVQIMRGRSCGTRLRRCLELLAP